MMRNIVILATFSFMAGCASNISPQSYSVGSVGQVNRTVAATVISVRSVNIAGTTGVGGATGTASGVIIGSAASGGNGRGSALGAIAGAVAGGLIGAAIESNATQQSGNEYVLETENGNLMTIVQGLEPMFLVGQKVLILYGSPARIINDPRPK